MMDNNDIKRSEEYPEFVRTGLMICPHCREKLDTVGQPGNDAPIPQPGDWTICMYCKALLEFYKDMTTLIGVTVDQLKKVRDEDPGMYAKLVPLLDFVDQFEL